MELSGRMHFLCRILIYDSFLSHFAGFYFHHTLSVSIIHPAARRRWHRFPANVDNSTRLLAHAAHAIR